ncbi:putative membrane protein [Propionispora sp. 2/2-37]|uniref:hypothetical protein n=1 Tax=Propionispora sp. 2/2-37 TaxID=1677858 RepID=UPI0006BB61E4|nr:hypothetical protein [Propionispora sp. 2/2-37]CUH96146.1 putative membrane protein [Propionispora sp. 2/2-37]
MFTVLAVIILSLVLPVSLWLRVCWFRQQSEKMEVRASPLSLAVQELLANAGGIYLSLVMLISFLKIDIPEKTVIFGVGIDPLPCTAIILAIIQPLFLRLFYKK